MSMPTPRIGMPPKQSPRQRAPCISLSAHQAHTLQSPLTTRSAHRTYLLLLVLCLTSSLSRAPLPPPQVAASVAIDWAIASS